MLIEDEARRVYLVNPEFCALFQIPLPPAELLGADCAGTAQLAAALIREPEAFLARIGQVLAGRAPVRGDEINFHDGRVLERDYTPIAVDAVGRGHLWIYRDVTRLRHDAELRHAAEVRDQLRLAVDTIPGLLLLALPDGSRLN